MKIGDEQLQQLVEASLFASDKPLTKAELLESSLQGFSLSRTRLDKAIRQLQADYAGRGVQLVETASGYHFQTRAELSVFLARLWPERSPRYSRAVLETLALIAYRQPITRGEIEEIRGVSVSTQIMRSLQERGWVKIVGHKEVPGRPGLYATTPQFLDYFGVKSLAELPALPELTPLSLHTVGMTEERPHE